MEYRFVDIHSHILPGIDDGAQTVEEANKMLEIAYQEGIRTIIATPHYAVDATNWSKEQTEEVFQKMKKQIKEKYPDLTIALGNEIFYSDGVVEALKKGQLYTMAESKYVLVEFLPRVTYKAIYQAIRELVMARFRPIIAHVERYECLIKNRDGLDELIELGAYLQMNSKSLLGGIFDERTRWCKTLVKEGYITFIGTDTHNTETRKPLMEQAAKWVEKKCGTEGMEELFGNNARKILAHEYIERD